MSIFKGALSASIQENHQFFSSNELLKSMGLSSFTKTSCSIIYNKNRNLLTGSIFSSLQRSIGQNTTILDIGMGTICRYTRFDKNAQSFDLAKTSITLNNLYQLIDYHEKLQLESDVTARQSTKDQQIIDINTSLEKCVVCETTILGTLLRIELRFQDRKNRSNERKIAFPNMVIAQPPSMPMGISYSQTASSNHQSSNSSNIGSYIPNSQSNFAQDSVAAPLQMFYDSNTNKWKSGNVQILARLLTDVEPAPIEPLDDSVNLNNAQEVISRTTAYTTGLALPLSIEQGNPYLFGPTFQQYTEKNIIKVPVVNRASRSFAKDTVVMLTEINGEWIVQDFGQTVDVKSPIKFGDWSFFKYIANSDSYFKDARYYDTGEDTYLTDVKPTIYEQQSRYQFYFNILKTWINNTSFVQDGIERPSLLTIYGNELQNIVRLNIGTSTTTFEPSTKFYISTIFDQLHTNVGGFSDKTVLDGVNISDPLLFVDSITQKYLNPERVATFWGPVYQDGFKKFIYNPNGKDNNNLEFFGSVSNPPDPTLFPPFEQTASIERRLLNMPAECGSIFINPLSIFIGWNNLGKSLFLIDNQYIHSPYYGTSEPVSKNKIQFSPLYAELVASRNTYVDQQRNLIIQKFNSTGLLGNLFDRSFRFGFNDVSDLPHVRIADRGAASPISDLKQPPNSTGGMPIAAYEPWETWSNLSGPKGPFCVGVISAKQTISKRGGGTINLSINQTTGRTGRISTTGGGFNNTLAILPGGIMIGGAGSVPSFTSQIPTWGSRTDSISSFGTTALHIRIFDYWPEDQTIFDPRYFGVLHFNAGSYYGDGTLTNINGESQESLQKRIDKAKTLDIPIPTKDLPQEENPFGESIDILTNGEIINKDTKLKSKSDWKLNPIRRGALLSAGGFIYLYHVIGLYIPQLLFGGTGFTSDLEYSVASKNVKLKLISSIGNTITNLEFVKDNLDNDLRGDNFLPEDFDMATPIIDQNGNIIGYDEENRGYILTIPSQTQGGKPAIIKFSNGIVWLKKGKDEAPKEQVPTSRLTLGSTTGDGGIIIGGRENTFELTNNNSSQYDCFYHFHNDILHTLGTSKYGSGHPSYAQYVNLTIT